MTLLAVFSACLAVAVLLSGLAHRTVLSTAVLFLACGIGLGSAGFGHLGTHSAGVVARIALFAVLFADGLRTPLASLRQDWHPPLRALLIGLPLALVLNTLAARAVAGLPWGHALLLGAILAPTDPVLAQALIGEEAVPRRLRHLLNVESGFNDGLALPFVIVFLSVAQHQHISALHLFGEIAGGLGIGIAVPAVVIGAAHVPLLGASERYLPIGGIAIALLVYSLASITGANLFLAVFAASIAVATFRPSAADEIGAVAGAVSETAKLAAIFVFGALLPSAAGGTWWRTVLFVALTLVAVRPVALSIAFVGMSVPPLERVAAMWFGPKGMSSLAYALIVYDAGAPHATAILRLTGFVVATSIVAHSSTDILLARRFMAREAAEEAADQPDRNPPP